MIFKFILRTDEAASFKREIQIDGDATFLDFYNTILASTNISKEEVCSFFLTDERWRKKQEITLIEMDSDSDEDIFLMEESVLNDLIEDENQKLLFVFDYLHERMLYIELVEIIPGKNLKTPKVTVSEGDIEELKETPVEEVKTPAKNIDTDENFFGDDVDLSEIDKEGFDGFYDEGEAEPSVDSEDLY